MNPKKKAAELSEAPTAHLMKLNELDGKGTNNSSDIQIVHDYFRAKPATRFQCEIDTGIPRPYICWYVRHLRLNGYIQVFNLGRCPVSKSDGVEFLTTNPDLFNQELKQPSLFDQLWEQT